MRGRMIRRPDRNLLPFLRRSGPAQLVVDERQVGQHGDVVSSARQDRAGLLRLSMQVGRGGLLEQTVRFRLQRLVVGGAQLRFGLGGEPQLLPGPREIRVRHRREPILGERQLQTASRGDRFAGLQIVHALLPIRHGLRAGLGGP